MIKVKVKAVQLQSQTITLDSGFLFPPYPLPNVVLQVGKKIERKVDIIGATLKERKRRRAVSSEGGQRLLAGIVALKFKSTSKCCK